MDFTEIIAVSIIIIIFLVSFIMSIKADDIKTLKYTRILKNETMVLFPIAIILLGYQIIKSGSWGLSPKTYNYILIFMNIANCFMLITQLSQPK